VRSGFRRSRNSGRASGAAHLDAREARNAGTKFRPEILVTLASTAAGSASAWSDAGISDGCDPPRTAFDACSVDADCEQGMYCNGGGLCVCSEPPRTPDGGPGESTRPRPMDEPMGSMDDPMNAPPSGCSVSAPGGAAWLLGLLGLLAVRAARCRRGGSRR